MRDDTKNGCVGDYISMGFWSNYFVDFYINILIIDTLLYTPLISSVGSVVPVRLGQYITYDIPPLLPTVFHCNAPINVKLQAGGGWA